ncbi:MAG: tetratricopeptide repeat protein [Cyclobacteriaceae bacterium]|nr:tetratricopeptide repeat protein [Cyclobacteriaceae bacterium]
MKSIIRFFLLILLSGISLTGNAQPGLEELKQRLIDAPNDSIRIRTLVELSQASDYLDHAMAQQYIQDAISLAESHNWAWAKGIAYYQRGTLETVEGDHSSALKYDNQALSLFASIHDSVNYNRLLNGVGNDYRDLDEFDDAYFYFTQSYEQAKRRNDSLLMAISLHNIGTIFTELKQYEIAIGHFDVAQRISTAIGDADMEPYTLNEKGALNSKRGDLVSAEKLLLSGLQKARMRKILVLIPIIQSRVAKVYLQKGDYARSVAYYDSVIAGSQQLNNLYMIAECKLGKGMVMAKLGKYPEAQQFFDESLEAALRLDARNLELTCYSEMSALYEKRGDFKHAIEYIKMHDALRDSVFSESMIEKLFQSQLRFETQARDTEIAALSAQRIAQEGAIRRTEFVRNILVVVVALTAILLFTIYRSGQRRIKINKLLLEHQEEIKRRTIELEELNKVKDKFFSIISHDLRSPMNALSAVLDLMDKNGIQPDEFARLTRELRAQFNNTRALINNLLDWALMQMDKLSFLPERIELSRVVDENLRMIQTVHVKEIQMVNRVGDRVMALADHNMINLVLRNLIMNAIKFTDQGGTIAIESFQNEEMVTVAISDNGVGIDPDVQRILFDKTAGYSSRGTANEKGTGLGLILCKEFVERNGGKIWFESVPGKGTTFYFTLPRA